MAAGVSRTGLSRRAADDSLRPIAPFGQAVAIYHHKCRRNRQRLDCTCHGQHGRLQNVDPVDFLDTAQADGPAAFRLYLLFQGRPHLGRQLFAVIQSGNALFAQDHGGGDYRPCKRAPPCFVHPDNHIRQAG